MKEEFAPVPGDLPNENTWFQPALPRATLVDADWRIEALQGLRSIGADELVVLRELAPHNVALARLAASRQPVARRSASELALVYGPLAEFHVGIMGSLAQAAWYDPADYRARQGALCEITPQSCLLFGFRLAEMGFPDEAAAAYQKGFDAAPDRVGAANESRWLVDYYFDRGKLQKAEAVAREAAAVYSSSGLFTMARLMERMGRQREAEEYYRRILDRYRDADELAGFYYRQARIEKKAAYEPKLKDALALALPSGLEPLVRATLTATPTDGVVIKGANDNTKRHGIQFGHVIVGLDGFRVRDVDAYYVVKALSQSPKMKLVIWRGQSYDDVETELWGETRVAMETSRRRRR
jgi:tetratricopeptide (TPR) repeat protein